MRAVLDTNVIVADTWRQATASDDFLQHWLTGTFELVLSELLLDEIEEVLRRSRIQARNRWTDEQTARFTTVLRLRSVFVETDKRLNVVRDESDNRILEAAIAAEADYIVTSDEDLLVLRRYEGVEIVTPERFLALLRAQ